jgi:formate hydrogenlyase subunit 6/NADH:ubiquinone oxidoreductase subunit I
MTETNQLASVWDVKSPQVIGSRCLNARHRKRDCHLCEKACPVEAISIAPDAQGVSAVTLDPQTCVRCGLCLNVCPTGVFTQTNSPEPSLVQAIARSTDETIEVACPLKQPLDQTQVPGASVVQSPRCLAALSVPMLLELAAAGKTIWLNDSLCATCPIGQTRSAIQDALHTANRWLRATGHAPCVHSYVTSPDELADPSESPAVLPENRDVVSRRDFFKSIAQAGEAVASRTTPTRSRPESAKEVAPRGLPHHIPAQRQDLAYALGQLPHPPSTYVWITDLPIADVTITDACTACNLCAQFCPTEAISFVSDDEYYVLNFSAALCLGDDCSLCVIGCPTDAIRFGQQVMFDELLSTQPRPIRAGRLVPCPQCGAPIHAPNEPDESGAVQLCHICQAQANRSSGTPSFLTPGDK